ncbi:hypothetical protein LCGC14_2152680 [marine sediment metagenome]|uniref:MmcB family DNA repair protein n=1 Tax=marine sediment metagenome TaxID=412755 RepID=A0A0F9EH88_9ZZZZ
MSKDKITALEIKHALMYYFRFKRQWICASECLQNDVMAITNKGVIEVEVKISKYDLWKGEAKKRKHKWYKVGVNAHYNYLIPNKFYICIPTYLLEEAEKWVSEINKKYGIILYNKKLWIGNSIYIKKSAQILCKTFNEGLKESIMKRVCSENIGLIGNLLEENNE